MKKRIFGKKLRRDINERKALFKGLMSSFVLSDRIKTTESKAKAIRPQIEKLVTKAKKGEASAKKFLEKSLTNEALNRLINDVAPSFANRNGGYTRLTKLGNRLGDNTTLVLLEWTETITRTPIVKEELKTKKKEEKETTKKKVRKTTKKL